MENPTTLGEAYAAWSSLKCDKGLKNVFMAASVNVVAAAAVVEQLGATTAEDLQNLDLSDITGLGLNPMDSRKLQALVSEARERGKAKQLKPQLVGALETPRVSGVLDREARSTKPR